MFYLYAEFNKDYFNGSNIFLLLGLTAKHLPKYFFQFEPVLLGVRASK